MERENKGHIKNQLSSNREGPEESGFREMHFFLHVALTKHLRVYKALSPPILSARVLSRDLSGCHHP